MKKLDFTLGFYYLNAVFLRNKENKKEKAKELRNRLFF